MMNTPIIYTVLAWEKDLEIREQASKRHRYYFGVEEPVIQPCKETPRRVFERPRPQTVCECPC